MEIPSDPTGAATGREPSGKRAVAKAAPPTNSTEARLSRVRDYLAHSLQKKDPLEANLGSINSGLMSIALRLEETIEQSMESVPPNLERLAEVSPAIETCLKVTRQVDRFANIELRAEEARTPKPSPGKGAAPRVDPPSSTASDPSEDSDI